MADDQQAALISIGEFARRSRLTVKALRIYHNAGLLQPATIWENGYRRYAVSQLRTGRLIALLRGADLSLAEIRQVLADLGADADAAVTRLEQLVNERDEEHSKRMSLLRHIQSTLRGGANPMFEVKTRHVPAYRLMSIQRRLYAAETDRFAREARAAFAEHLDGAPPAGPFMLIFHGPVNDESDGPLEAALPCPDQIQPTAAIGVRTEPAHNEAYTTITKAQWEYPAILAAYDTVGRSSLVSERPHSPLSCREVYLTEPEKIEAGDLICDVAFPLA